MKRIVAMAVLGCVTGMTRPVQGAGSFFFNNYFSPYVPITYQVSENVAPYYPQYTDGAPVGVDDGIQIQVWWALGSPGNPPPLAFGAQANWSAYDGYTDPSQIFTIPDYEPGQTVYLQLRTENDLFLGGAGPIIEVAQIAYQGDEPPLPPPWIHTPGFEVIVPEPSVLSLVGLLGGVAILARRRR